MENIGKSPFLMGKLYSYVSLLAIFNSYVSLPDGKPSGNDM